MNLLRLVRKGRTIRLKAPEGTFSYYHPNHLFTGFSWDAQTASLLLVKDTPHTILILGLGGGTVARQCRMLYPHARIVGVEIDRWVLKVAYAYFELGSLNLFPVVISGEAYLKKTRRRFDAIIDDMWLPHPKSPKPILVEPDWVHIISSRLKSGGVYSVNLYNRSENPAEIRTAVLKLKSLFPDILEIRPNLGPTTVVAAGFSLHTPREARAKLRSLPVPLAAGLKHVRFLTL